MLKRSIELLGSSCAGVEVVVGGGLIEQKAKVFLKCLRIDFIAKRRDGRTVGFFVTEVPLRQIVITLVQQGVSVDLIGRRMAQREHVICDMG
ncbi:hypothetical protein D3C72_1950930 [compost metagenome]